MIPLIAFAAVLFGLLLRYFQLRVRLGRSERDWASCRMRLISLGEELARYAWAHHGRLPVDLQPVLRALPRSGSGCDYTYRPVPRLDTDERLILAYDDAPRHPLMEFPRLGEGRNVLFASGRVDLFAEEAVHQLVVGDNVLRGRLGLPEVPFLEVQRGEA